MTNIQFTTKLNKIKSWNIIIIPKEVSEKFSSRGLVMIEGTINNVPFKTMLEPDGRGGHWFKLDNILTKKALINDTSLVNLSVSQTKEWISPKVPDDLKKALLSNPTANSTWQSVTPLAKWDWIRWIRAVKSDELRKKHINVAIDKLNKGIRRPCCFNRNLCSEPYVAHNWVLLST